MRQSNTLIEAAAAVRLNAHAPYSRFKVGAAVRGASGAVYVGCNVENASYGATLCAERAAIAALVAAGERELTQVAIFTEASEPTPPCGICRQVIAEFGKDAQIFAATPQEQREYSSAELLPSAFTFSP